MIKVYGSILEQPSSDLYPNASKWYQAISGKLTSSFPGKAVGVRFGSQAAPATAIVAKEAAKPSNDNDDDDSIDLFGEETKKENKAAEPREAAKASSEKKESGKSSIFMDVKPWDDETNIKKLEEVVRSIEVEGLLWGASKSVPVGYGIKKKQIMLTIINELISVDTLIEERITLEPINEYVQSCDIVAFNKT
ncbi:Elongation factor 1-delta 2 [Capsicum annuum]|nr:Elongation factor 1-delta 2 [Capsicum annuum]